METQEKKEFIEVYPVILKIGDGESFPTVRVFTSFTQAENYCNGAYDFFDLYEAKIDVSDFKRFLKSLYFVDLRKVKKDDLRKILNEGVFAKYYFSRENLIEKKLLKIYS